MKRPLDIVIAKSAKGYFERLDNSTQERIRNKLQNVAADPENFRYSETLRNSASRSAYVGGWRILLQIVDDEILLVTDIDRRGQVYRNLKRR